ncbi:UDP-N-acetylmuramoyl-L-alanyl-D-glutamate--2,6-diaminopimelate ligase, partial [Salmonella enterica subsp. enterica serovar Typhimurium]
MMQVTAEISDRYILTMDDLNGVSADQMIEELQNLNNDYGNDKGFLIPDRTLAIQWTMKNSTSGEWILIT